ncbi:MAG TPA: ABC transporter permease, partial [Thermoanaerobaculia bacterium]|nr:ABC transporter permease [Thermoanaerobaculia bacterium]
YLQAVRKKMFIIMTFLLPFLMSGLFVVPGLLMTRGLGEKRVAVVDGTGQLRAAFEAKEPRPTTPRQELRSSLEGKKSPAPPSNLHVEYVDASKAGDVIAAAKPYLDRMVGENVSKDMRLDGVFTIPAKALNDSDGKLTYYSRSSTDLFDQERLSSRVNRAIQRRRLAEHGVTGEELDRVMKQLSVDAVQLSKSGKQKKGGEWNFFVGFIFAALLILPSFIYGVEIMRGIIQEKTDRVVEILVSSMTPRQLLTGKILGLAAVGLTQLLVWILMGAIAGLFGIASAEAAGFNLLQFINPAVCLYFLLFFILGYMMYVCLYAIVGSVCNSEKEAQQMIAPISMFMMLPWFLMAPIITNPDSKLAVALSLSPVFAPITMFVRILVSEPPVWHILMAVLVSIATISVFFWATAKVFRLGILSYGKRPTIPELLRWIRYA